MNSLGESPDLQLQRQVDGLRQAHVDVRLLDGLEALKLRPDGVRPRREEGKVEATPAVRRRRPGALRTCGGDGGARHRQALLVDDPTLDRAGRLLVLRARQSGTSEEERHQYRHASKVHSPCSLQDSTSWRCTSTAHYIVRSIAAL